MEQFVSASSYFSDFFALIFLLDDEAIRKYSGNA